MLKQAIRGDMVNKAVRLLMTGRAGPALTRRVGNLDIASNPRLGMDMKRIAADAADPNRGIIADLLRKHRPIAPGPNVIDLSKKFPLHGSGTKEIADILAPFKEKLPGGYMYQAARQGGLKAAANQSETHMYQLTPLAAFTELKQAAQFKSMLTGKGQSQFLSPLIPSGLPMGREAKPQPISGNPSGKGPKSVTAPPAPPANKAMTPKKASAPAADMRKVAALLKAVKPLGQLFQKASPTIKSQVGKIRLPQQLGHLGNLRQQTFGALPQQMQQAIMNRTLAPGMGGSWNAGYGQLHDLVRRQLGQVG